MGSAQVKGGEEPRVLLTEYNDLAYRDALGSYKLFKVMECVHEREENVVVKLFIHREGAPDLKAIQQKVLGFKAVFASHWMHPNVVPYQGMEIAPRSAILLRPHFARHLHDRMHTRPFLSELTKNWLAFQVLCSVCQAHSMGVAHCDLKTENIFVSSWDHVVLSDFAWFKPLFLPEDDPSEFSFFFESNLNRRRCYLAPERFDGATRRGSSSAHEGFSEELEAMDIFSLGCVLAEIFLDGQTVMDMPQLLLYRANQFDLSAKIAGIRNAAVREIVSSMLHRDPSKRRPAVEYLRLWCENASPRAFCSCLYPLSVLLLHPIYLQTDMRVILLRQNFAHILWAAVGPDKIGRALEARKGKDLGDGSIPAASSVAATEAASEIASSPPSTVSVWEAWLRHIDRKVRSADEAALHVAAHAAVSAAAQWGTHSLVHSSAAAATSGGTPTLLAESSDAFSPERSRLRCSSSSNASRGEASGSGGGVGCARRSACGDEGDDTLEAGLDREANISHGHRSSLQQLIQPILREESCERFTAALIGRWEEGRRRAVETGEVQPGETQTDSAIFRSFLVDLCGPGRDQPPPRVGSRSESPGDMQFATSMSASAASEEGGVDATAAVGATASTAGIGGSAGGIVDHDDVLSVVCGLVCACVQHLSGPRVRMICLDMFEQMAPFASRHAILEQLVPFTHMLMTDRLAKVRARAVDVLAAILGHVGELPPADAPLFVEYLFPQLVSALGGMAAEPVVLLAIARNIGALAHHAVRFAELSVEAAQRHTVGGDGSQKGANTSGKADVAESRSGTGVTDATSHGASAAPVASASAAVAAAEEVETFDVQRRHLREAIKKIVKALLECLPVGHQAEQRGTSFGGAGGFDTDGAGQHEESLMNLAMGREIKMALLRNMCILADVLGRDGTHNFLLPYLISFMNDPAWEVRACFCEEAARLPRKVGQVSTEGIIWPCYEQALLDQEERVLEAALAGLAVLVEQVVLRRRSLVTVATKVAPLLVHPADALRRRAAAVFEALGEQLSIVDQYVFVMPAVRPFLRLDVANLRSIGEKLQRPLSRHFFKQAVLNTDEELYDALINKKPLPVRVAADAVENDAALGEPTLETVSESSDLAALELMRPYVQLLLGSRPCNLSSARPLSGSGEDIVAANMIGGSPAMLQGVQYHVVNPHCAANRSLQVLTEEDGGCLLPAAMQPEVKHPLGLFSVQAILAQALSLPPKRQDFGSLSYLDGTPYSIYAADAGRLESSEAVAAYLRGAETASAFAKAGSTFGVTESDAGYSGHGGSSLRQALVGGYPLSTSTGPSGADVVAGRGRQSTSDPWKDVADSHDTTSAGTFAEAVQQPQLVLAGLSGVAAMAASSGIGDLRRSLGVGGFEAEGDAERERSRAAAAQTRASASWRPRGMLLATLYEYAHHSGVPVVKVDSTDDSRILVTGGRDGVVKIWNCAALERDVAVASSHTFALPMLDGVSGSAPQRKQRLRTLRTLRDSKSVAVGSESGDVLLYKVEPGRGGATAVPVGQLAARERHGACAVMCLEQFDTELESLVVIVQQHGKVQGWDVRSRSRSWSMAAVPPSLGVPSCLALGSDGHSVTIGTLGGGLVVYDLRFLAPWKHWRVSTGAAVLSLRTAGFRGSPSAFAALGGDANEVAVFDVARGTCATLFLTEQVTDKVRGDTAVSVPTLLPVNSSHLSSSAAVPDQWQASNLFGGCRRSGAGCVRSIWLPPRGGQTFFLAAGTDRKVRHWSLDPEQHITEAYVVTPPDPISNDASRGRATYSSNHLGDVFVVQEQSEPRSEPSSSSRGTPRPMQAGTGGGTDVDGSRGSVLGGTTNPNHRDAILDMCAISLQHDVLVTAGRDGLVKLWK
eukprot:TRINITY_DN4873_c0_g1_i1.p1 TRINITY_DN4873_c0_g1~~TRINITY_DN4873_c0_g1_i1.p1  ORF type:complete len:1862 (-),score=341.37 TRINITY_DN4873_c0_g1_i1:313-5898(-)